MMPFPPIDLDLRLFDSWYLPPLAIALGVPLVFERARNSRAFAAASVVVASVTLFLTAAYDAPPMRLLAAVLVLFLLRALLRLGARPRALYAPPPDPPDFGGPYR